jgi:hypothetical protein
MVGTQLAPFRRPLRVQRTDGLATLLIALLTVMALASVAVAAVLLDRARVLGEPGATSSAIIDASRRGARAKRLYELGVLATGVVWIRWQVHYVRNVRTLGRPTGLPLPWAVVGWLLPGVNLVVPQRQLAVSARSSDPSRTPSTPTVLYAWWAALVAALALLATGTVVRPPEGDLARSTLGDFQAADRLHAASMAAAAIAAVLGILTVFRCTNRQQALIAPPAVATVAHG